MLNAINRQQGSTWPGMPEDLAHQWPAKVHLDDTSIPRLPPPLASSTSFRGHSRSRTVIDIPPLLPSRRLSHSPTQSSTFLPFFNNSRSSSPKRSPASPAEAAEFTVDDSEVPPQRRDRPGKVERLAGWFEGSSEPVNIGLVASPKQELGNSITENQIMETIFSGGQDSRSVMQSAHSSTSRFSLFSRKSSTIQQRPNPDDLAHLDIKSALFPDGPADEFSPAAFKNLQQNAEGLLRMLQTAYKDNLAALRKTTSERNIQADELEAEQTRNTHLKIQLTEMSDRANEQEKLLASLKAENEKLKANETALKSIRVITDHTTLDPPRTPEAGDTTRLRKNRSSDISFADSVDSGATDLTNAESVFSHEGDGRLAEQLRSPGTSIGCPSPVLKNTSRGVTPSIQHSPHIEHLRSLTTDIMVAECQKCKGMKPQEAWDVLSVMQPENQALKERVVELERAVEEAFNICVWHPEV